MYNYNKVNKKELQVKMYILSENDKIEIKKVVEQSVNEKTALDKFEEELQQQWVEWGVKEPKKEGLIKHIKSESNFNYICYFQILTPLRSLIIKLMGKTKDGYNYGLYINEEEKKENSISYIIQRSLPRSYYFSEEDCSKIMNIVDEYLNLYCAKYDNLSYFLSSKEEEKWDKTSLLGEVTGKIYYSVVWTK